MEPLSSDDSSDAEIKIMKNQLSEFGLEEDNLSKEEMRDLIKAFNNSKCSASEDELKLHLKVDKSTDLSPPRNTMKRRYLNVKDRRMPWSVLPTTITQAEKARTLAVYIKLMSVNNYKLARQSPNFIAWPPPIQIVEESSRVQPLRSTRSGRNVPVYAGFDDDSSDADFVVSKNKKRKVSVTEQNVDGTYSTKVVSLKRKSSKDENTRPIKEPKMVSDGNKLEATTSKNTTIKKDLFSLIED